MTQRAMFFLGQGDDAYPFGSISSNTAVTPDAIAVLPVGRRALTATDLDVYCLQVENVLAAWYLGGFGDTRYPDEDGVDTTCPNTDGRLPARSSGPSFDLAYTFDHDQGQVLQWREGHWQPISLSAPADAIPHRYVQET